MTDLDHPNNGTADPSPATGQWQIRFEPGATKEAIERIADFAVAEGICGPDSADFIRAGRDPRYWYSGALNRDEVDAHRRTLRAVLNDEPLTAEDFDLMRESIRQFDDWLRDLAYPREASYDADTTFFDFD
ncbi:hypothetical protein [Nocardia sp. NPDC057030]|uniref:hypothetical protein n=1 Tax=unclassified Nocardia TaxID=2637762 RepID=UPI003629A9DA